jgi:hypothetical protein
MRLVDNYNYLPGCCWFCRGISTPVIDCEIDLDGVNSPDDDNPSAITRLYVCPDCAIEMARMVAPSRSLELTRLGELGMANRVASELAQQYEAAETRLAAIADAISRVTSRKVETAGSTEVPDEGRAESAPSEQTDVTPLRRPGRPRREQPKAKPEPEINTDFVGDL